MAKTKILYILIPSRGTDLLDSMFGATNQRKAGVVDEGLQMLSRSDLAV